MQRMFSAWDPGVRTAKNYERLTGTEQAMILAQNDPAKTRLLAGELLDHHAKLMAGSHVRGTGQVSPESYRDALASLRAQFPSLARAADDGYISATDWSLLGSLILAPRARSRTATASIR